MSIPFSARLGPLVAGLWLATLAGCRYSLNIDDGLIACGADSGACPSGLQCVVLPRTPPLSVCCRDESCTGIDVASARDALPGPDGGGAVPLDGSPADGEEDAPADVPTALDGPGGTIDSRPADSQTDVAVPDVRLPDVMAPAPC